MPSWKLRYSEEDRWKLVHYIRGIFTQTEDAPKPPPKGSDFNYPDFFRDQMRFPDDVSFARGKTAFLQNCAHCHGLAGDGQGWDGQYLNPQPFDFRNMAGKSMKPEAQGEHIAKVSFGINGTAMPVWGEWLTWGERWDAVKFLMGGFMAGKPAQQSLYTGEVPATLLTLSQQNWIDEGHSIDKDAGKALYAQYCVTCHADDGQGNGPGTQGNASGSPAPLPAGMQDAYVFWRIRDGVPDAVMPAFHWYFAISEGDIWNIMSYTQELLNPTTALLVPPETAGRATSTAGTTAGVALDEGGPL